MAITVLTDYDAIKGALISWITTYSGVNEAIFKNQDAPRPARPYAAFLITSDGGRFGIDEARQSYDAGSQVIQRNTAGLRKMNVQLDMYSEPAQAVGEKEAADYLNNLLLTLDTVAVRDLFKDANLTVLDHTSVNRLDEQLGDRWERRAQVDLTLLYTGETFDDGGGSSGDWIETVEVPTTENGNLTLNE
ncbi:MAG: hypothetical protein SV201_13750 [Pseudomonadota bacterium]|nr:hypothetical protein [Pseudomonadota bacterium]